jgi:hypothetical protein
MVFIVQPPSNFCPAPWIGFFYHSNAASPCCTMQPDKMPKMSPEEYFKSDWLTSLKQEFLDGKKPERCTSCWIKESQGLVSIRSYFINKYPFDETLLTQPTKHMEFRESNLCNFACRMCNPTDSVKIEREVESFPKPINDQITDSVTQVEEPKVVKPRTPRKPRVKKEVVK